jgi:hypothetical protein
MTDELIEIGDGFWNIRGSFRVGPLDVGTQASLVRRPSGKFVMLDAYTVEGSVKDEVFELTRDGHDIEAILMLHPFHTVHVKRVAAMFPDARLYGTRRHIERAPELEWETEHTDSAEAQELFADLLWLTVPSGIELIPDNESLHFGSVLAIHPASRTLHVDDTLTYTRIPLVGGLRFHPALRWVLREEAGAAARFRDWANELADRCAEVDQICTAHGPHLPPSRGEGFDPETAVREALAKVEGVLRRHERRHG